MPDYDLDRLGDQEFERMCQSLLKEVIGHGTITLGGAGPDGGRDAIFHGRAPYPSLGQQWDGNWVFQVKFHNTKLIGVEKARKEVLRDLESELEKVVNKYPAKCDNYILITNVSLSSMSGSGTFDRITSDVAPKFSKNIRNIHVWGASEICRFLEKYPSIRRSYLQFLTPGDLIAELIDTRIASQNRLAETIKLYVKGSFDREQYALLTQTSEIQTGEPGEVRIQLQRVFIDLDARSSYFGHERPRFSIPSWLSDSLEVGEPISTMQVLLHEGAPRITLIGGPGQGKSTLGQYVAQVHRAAILNRLSILDLPIELTPLIARVPFRVVLREYAEWLSENKANETLEFFLAQKVKERAGREISAEDIQNIMKGNPCLLILDGLDEVTDRPLQTEMIARITEFLGRCEEVFNANLQVLATTRPTGYTDQFDPMLYLNLETLSHEKVLEYVARWAKAKALEPADAQSLRDKINRCLRDPSFHSLMNTPLQVTILILIVLSGGIPPTQREALFDHYLEIIINREKAKSDAILRTDKDQLLALHRYLGYVLHSRATGENVACVLKADELMKEIKRYLRFKDPVSSQKVLDERSELMAKESLERLVLIVEPRNGLYGFELRSIQEYCAAGHLADTARDTKQRYDRFKAIASSPHWRNVALFFAGRAQRKYEGEAGRILEVCKAVDRGKPDLFIHRGAWLSLELATDRSFASDRELQRNVIEYSVSLLDKELSSQDLSTIQMKLRDLPKDDIQDILGPLLKEKMGSIRLPVLTNYLDTYFSIFGCDVALLDVLGTMMESDSPDESVVGFTKALEYAALPNWLSKYLNKIISRLTPDEFARTMAGKCLEMPEYMRTCFRQTDFSQLQVQSLLDRISKYRPFRYQYPATRPNQGSATYFDLTTSKNQIWTALSSCKVLAEMVRLQLRMAGYAGPRSLPDLSGYDGDRLDNDELLRILPFFADEASMLTNLAQVQMLPLIRTLLWSIALVLRSESPKCLRAFLEYQNSLTDKEDRLPPFFRHVVLDANPLLFIFLENLGAPPKRMDEIIQMIAGSEAKTDQLRKYLLGPRALLDEMNAPDREYLFKVMMFGSSFEESPPPHELEDLCRAVVMPPKTYYPVVSQLLRIQHEVRLTSKETVRLLGEVSEACNGDKGVEKAVIIARRLAFRWVVWTIDDAVLDALKELTNSLMSSANLRPAEVAQTAASICVKLLNTKVAQSEEWEHIALRLLKIVGRQNSVRATVGLVTVADDTDQVFTKLAAYLANPDLEIGSGAAKIASELVKDLSESHVSSSRRTLLQKSYFDVRYAQKLIQSNGEDQRIDGIGLLTLADLRGSLDWTWLFEEIRHCSGPNEAKAWASFLRRVGQGNSEIEPKWKSLLESILERFRAFPREVSLAALERYEGLARLRQPGIVLDELELNLPLDWESRTSIAQTVSP